MTRPQSAARALAGAAVGAQVRLMAGRERLLMGTAVLAVLSAVWLSLWAVCWAVTWLNVALEAVGGLVEDD